MSILLQQGAFADRYNFGYFLNCRELLGTAVEVGTHRGDFAWRFLFTWIGAEFYAVDPYLGGYDPDDPASRGDRNHDARLGQDRLSEFGTRVHWVRKPSVEAATRFANSSVGFVYVDARHRYESVSEDLRAWWPKVKPGGVLAGHDFLELGTTDRCDGVQRAVIDFARAEDVTIHLVTEPSGAPWSYYLVRG